MHRAKWQRLRLTLLLNQFLSQILLSTNLLFVPLLFESCSHYFHDILYVEMYYAPQRFVF